MVNSSLKSYLVSYTKQVDWYRITALTDFSYPWENLKAPAMIFKACHDLTSLCCRFEVTDSGAKVFVNNNSKEEVIQGDRVEIFFRKNESMDPYYCLEIDYLGRIYDYRATYHRKFEPHWTWPAGQLRVEAYKSDAGYTVEIRISLAALEELGFTDVNSTPCRPFSRTLRFLTRRHELDQLGQATVRITGLSYSVSIWNS